MTCCLSLLQIYISSTLANLYEGVKKKDWRLQYTGVPVLCYDKGSAKSRSSPRVTFVLAERGTCFALWRDTIDNLSSYKVSGPAFHTMCLSTGEFPSLPAGLPRIVSSQLLILLHAQITARQSDSALTQTERRRNFGRMSNASHPTQKTLLSPHRDGSERQRSRRNKSPCLPRLRFHSPVSFSTLQMSQRKTRRVIIAFKCS
jgi:hypothetical protein